MYAALQAFTADHARRQGKKHSVVPSEVVTELSSNVTIVDDLLNPTREEKQMLRRVPGRIGHVAYALCLMGSLEQASPDGTFAVFRFSSSFICPQAVTGLVLLRWCFSAWDIGDSRRSGHGLTSHLCSRGSFLDLLRSVANL
jgi:hypothetical protein